MTLTGDQRGRYDRNVLIPGIGERGQEALLAARVLVVGAGGLGTPVILYLAAAGVGHLTIADADSVEASNLQRQVIHRTRDVGGSKTASAARAVADLNPDVSVTEVGWVTDENADELCRAHDLVVACTDSYASDYAVADAAARTGTPLVWGTIVSMSYQVSVFWSRPPAGQTPRTLRGLHPAPPAEGATDGAAQIGVLGAVVGQCGSVMATEAVKVLTGVGTPLLGRVLVSDARAGTWDVIELAEDAR